MWTLITGAGSGIGRALALELASRGHNLILAGRTASRLEEVAAAIQRDSPASDVMIEPVDLADPASTRALARRVMATARQLSTFVYCAGVGEPAADFASMEFADFQQALAVNVSAPMLLTQSLLPVFTGGTEASRIVMVGAGMDKHVQPGTGSYGISKMALRRLVEQLAVEFEGMENGPLVSLFQPGLVDTPGIRTHTQSAANMKLPHADYLRQRLDSGKCLTAGQAALALALSLTRVSDRDFHGSVFKASDLLDSQ